MSLELGRTTEAREIPEIWPKTVTYGSPGGFCAGVDRAVDAYRDFAEKYPNEQLYSVGVPAHNPHVIEEFKGRYKFVESIAEVPVGVDAKAINGPHGDLEGDLQYAQVNGITYRRTECPLVTKVKDEIAENTEKGLITIYYGQIDKDGHFHTESKAAMSAGNIILVISLKEALSDEVAALIPDHTKVAFASQTTHNADHVFEMQEELEKKYPGIKTPKKEDTCYATKNRQDAAKEVKKEITVVVGDEATSSNTRSLARAAEEAGEGNKAIIVNNGDELRSEDFYGYDSVGVVASASAPKEQIRSVIDFFTSRGSVQETIEVADESRIRFKPPIDYKPYEPEFIWKVE